MDKRVDHVPAVDVPDPDCRVRRAGDDDSFVVLETEHGAGVPVEDSGASQRVAIPHLDRIVSQAGHNLGVVVLE